MDSEVLNREHDETKEQYAERLANIFGKDFVSKVVIIRKLPNGWDWKWRDEVYKKRKHGDEE